MIFLKLKIANVNFRTIVEYRNKSLHHSVSFYYILFYTVQYILSI
jgi:hypothetical protein